MSESEAKLFHVIRPVDGATVPLTCTDEQLQVWLDKGYKLAGKHEPKAKESSDKG